MKTLCRKCIVTGKIIPVSELIRIVKTKDGDFFVNSFAKGRGAYITRDDEIIKKALKRKVLHRTFKQKIDKKIYEELEKEIKG